MAPNLLRAVPLVLVLALAYACGAHRDTGDDAGDAGRGGKSATAGHGGTAGTAPGAGKGGGGKPAAGGDSGGSSGKPAAGGKSGKGGSGAGGKSSTGGSAGEEVAGGGMSEAGTGGSTGGTGHAGNGGAAGGEAGTGATSGGQGGEGGASIPTCDGGIDADGDGYGEGCAAGPDCNDFEKAIHPGAPEVCGNAFDDDCNAATSDDCPVTCPTGGCGAGCADGTREAFKDAATYPHIAGCDGGFSVPGVLHADTPLCGRVAGNDSANPNGTGCSAADLCAEGWHMCRHPAEVTAHSPDGCAGSHDATSSFYVTRQSGSGCGACAVSTDATKICTNADCNTDCYPTDLETNDVFGCGTLGSAPGASCAPFDRFGNNACGALGAPWDCAASSGYDEALVVVKNGPAAGGVLCCAD
jgi:hypothetical protein